MNLVDAYTHGSGLRILYDLLDERTPQQSISHERMPSWDEHVAYIAKRPVPYWYLLERDDGMIVGSIYLSRRREVGIQIFRIHFHMGYGTTAVEELALMHPGVLYANVAPMNWESHAFFNKLGGKIIQATYKFGG